MFRTNLLRSTRASRPSIVTPRFLSTTPTRFTKNYAQDKDSLDPQSTEYAKSGSDDSAAHSQAAFDPNQTKPETEERTAEKEGGGNSLNASPSNPAISKTKSPKSPGNEGAPEKKQSGAGSAPKNG